LSTDEYEYEDDSLEQCLGENNEDLTIENAFELNDEKDEQPEPENSSEVENFEIADNSKNDEDTQEFREPELAEVELENNASINENVDRDEEFSQEIIRRDDEEEKEKRHEYDLRSKRSRDYSYRFAMVSVKTGLEKWGDKAKDALLDELNLFIDQKVFEQEVNRIRREVR